MKTILVFVFILAFSRTNAQQIDTVQTFDFGKMPPVYFSDKIYWERNYDSNNHLLFEGLKYNSCFIGAFINYWKNGKVKTKGQYMENTSGDWKDLQGRNLCSVPTGEWKTFKENGEPDKTIVYENGKVVKEY